MAASGCDLLRSRRAEFLVCRRRPPFVRGHWNRDGSVCSSARSVVGFRSSSRAHSPELRTDERYHSTMRAWSLLAYALFAASLPRAVADDLPELGDVSRTTITAQQERL